MECISTFVIAHTVHCCWLIVITLLLVVTVVTVITAYLYWRCCCFLNNDCLFCESNIHVNLGAGRKILIWNWRGVGVMPMAIFNLC
jgi:hypothetical protein